MITPYNILAHELVGLQVKAKTGEKTIVGSVDEETEKTFKVKTQKGVETVVKDSAKLEFQLPQEARVAVEGKVLLGRPQDRVKKKHRIRF